MSILRDECLPRIPFAEPVNLEVEETGEVLSGQGLNLSCGGIFVCTEGLLAEGTRVRLGFALPGGRPVCTNAIVLRAVQPDEPREPVGMALRFEELPAAALREIDAYLESWLRPAAEEQRVRIELGELGIAITARPQSCWGSFLSVSAELPFLRLGSRVRLLDEQGDASEQGSIRWVSVQVPPGSGVPRLHIGIEVEPEGAEQAEAEHDPVCCPEFVDDSQALDRHLRTERRQASAQPS